jgi:DNA polymerase-4
MGDYSPHVVMKSIDEGVMDFHDTPLPGNLVDIGYDIKRRLKTEVGRAMRCNVGVGPNRFLAKTAAGLHKPDGLDLIDHTNLRETLARVKLTDLTGIAGQNEKRLNRVGIYTPLEFLDADAITLHKMVFHSVNGDQWHQRLRGYEVDDVEHGVKTIGRQYVLESHDLPRAEVLKRLHHLCESVGSRLRGQQKAARGVLVYTKSYDRQYWHRRSLAGLPFFSDKAIYAQAAMLFAGAPQGPMREIGISCYHLESGRNNQMMLFGDELAREQQVTMAVDAINQRFGDRTIHAADTLGTGFYVKQKVPFGSTRYL